MAHSHPNMQSGWLICDIEVRKPRRHGWGEYKKKVGSNEPEVQGIADKSGGRCSPSRHSQHWPAALRACTSWKLLGLIAESSLPSLALQ